MQSNSSPRALLAGDLMATDINPVTLFVCGDVMLGRGIDQILPHPSDPKIYEHYMDSALGYVRLAERRSGPIHAPRPFDYVWGDVLPDLDAARPLARIVNLETSVTTSTDPEPKGINYKMNPDNVICLKMAAVDCRVLVFAFGSTTSGIAREWAATSSRPGVNLLRDLSAATATEVAKRIVALRRPGDIVVVSIHWGTNWGYRVDEEQRTFAHALVDAGACDLLHGHSSHHPRGLEIYRGRLILYGCGDFITDYEGIEGYEQ